MENIYLGRQSLYDRSRELAGFQLLYGHGEADPADLDGGRMASARVMLDTLTGMGLESVVGQHTAFMTVERGFLMEDGPTAPVDPRIVYAFRPDIATDEPLLAALWHLAGDGRRFALDHFDGGEAACQFLAVVDYVSLDAGRLPEGRLRELVAQLRGYDVKLIAAGIESEEVLELATELDFDLYQGNHFAQPKMLKLRGVPTSRLAVLRLVGKLNDPEATIESVQEVIAQDVSLSYRVLRQINSAAYNLPAPVDSIRRAIMLLGLDAVKALATLLAMAGQEDQLDDLTTTALVRAKMCELLAERQAGVQGEVAFSVGLLSILDVVTQVPLHTVLDSLPLADHVHRALAHHDGPLGTILASALAYERGDWNLVDTSTMMPGEVSEAYFAAVNHAYRAAFEMM